MQQHEEQTLALAGIVQAGFLVNQLAKTGQALPDAMKTSVHSLFEFDPPNTAAVYGEQPNLRSGFTMLQEMLERNGVQQGEVLRYCMSTLHLERKLNGRNDLQQTVHNRLAQAKQQSLHFSETHENVIANLASIYVDTIATFRYRIQVTGSAELLGQEHIAAQIRALLLAGIRSAVLWRQLKGSRLQLLFQRRQIINDCQQLTRRFSG